VGHHAGGLEALCARASGIRTPPEAELYYLPDDFSQAHDLASEHPEKGRGTEGALLGGGREVQGSFRSWLLLSTSSGWFRPCRADEVRVPGDVQKRSVGDDPRRLQTTPTRFSADLVIPRAAPKVSSSPRRIISADSRCTEGRQADAHVLDMGVFLFKQVAEEAMPVRR